MTSAVVPPKVLPELAHHAEAALPPAYLPRQFHMGDALVSGADVFITSRSVVDLKEPAEPNVAPHKHDVSQTYMFVSDDGSLEFEIDIDGRHETGRAPASVFIPAGAMHSVRLLRGSGSIISIVRSGTYR
jgi:2-isopropylmalate synthase